MTHGQPDDGSLRLPDAGLLAWWGTAWLRGLVGPDDVVDAVRGESLAIHHVVAEDGDLEALTLGLGTIRRSGATAIGLALPADGDPVGLGGPAAFNTAAMEAGEAAVLSDAGVGLVPTSAGRGVVWQRFEARRRSVPDVGEADRGLRTTLLETARDLAELDVARWRPDVADALMNLRHLEVPVAPPGTPPRCIDLAARGLQALGIVDLALRDDGGAVSASEAERRRSALTPLAAAGRRAIVAACSPEGWPPPGR